MTDALSPLVSHLRPGKTFGRLRSASFRTAQSVRFLFLVPKGRRSCKPDLRHTVCRIFRHSIQIGLATILSLAGTHAQSLPKGGQYVGGSGGIATSGSDMTITQTSTHGIINWQAFSIGSANKVWFNNRNEATLNRVLGGNLSQIDGQLSATGSVYVINPNGLVVGPGGKIITGGSFIGSTLGISNQQFMTVAYSIARFYARIQIQAHPACLNALTAARYDSPAPTVDT